MFDLICRLWPMFPVTADVVKLLDSREGWTVDRLYARHEASGVEIWIANEAYGLTLSVEGRGQVFRLFDAYPMQRRHIWRAVRGWAVEKPSPFRQLDLGSAA